MVRIKPPQERRKQERQRTRLRSGKIVDLDGRFITECQLGDIAARGAKLRTVDTAILPERFWLFDDFHARALLARVAWRGQRELGVEFITDPAIPSLDETRLVQLAGKYYSL